MATYTVTTSETQQKIAEKGQTFYAFRFSIEKAQDFVSDSQNVVALSEPGVYLLIRDVDDEPPEVYVGEAEPLIKRIKQHIADRNKGKEFAWTEAVVFVNIANEWMKNDIKYIENGLYEELVKAGRYKVKNATVPTKSKVVDSALCIKHIEAIKQLAPWYGHTKLFKGKLVSKPKTLKTTTGKKTTADKVGKIAQEWFPKVFAAGGVTAADIKYLCSAAAVKDFKTRGNVVLREYCGSPKDYCDAKGRRRFYSMPPMACLGKKYILTSQLFPESKTPVISWLNAHGASI